ncbi:MAG: TetR family transcriptional regulator [Methyloprofundus sp.]|nr:TetR family transcriptional regulator [Methyloprofundus sp.]
MARRSEHSQAEIKQMVLQAAEDIVQEKGFSALKVRKIAGDIGCTVGSIYMVFSNMNDLNMHIKARTWQKLLLYLEQNPDEHVTPASIEKIAIAYLDFTVLNKGLWRMLFEHQLPVAEDAPDWYVQESERVVEFVYLVLKQLRPSYSDELMRQAARTLINSVQGVCIQLVMQPQSIENIKLAKEDVVFLIDCFMRGWMNGTE